MNSSNICYNNWDMDVWIGVMMMVIPDPGVMRGVRMFGYLSQLPIRKVIPEIEWQFDIWALI